MSRYWPSREGLSPYNSTLGQGVPAVTDEDFSYITTEDLENHGLDIPRTRDARSTDRHYARSAPDRQDDPEEDDVLLLKVNGVVYPTKFPAYSIGDGKLLVCDLRDRIMLNMKLSDRRARLMSMIYKNRLLDESTAPVRAFGVKNNSELLILLNDAKADSSDDSGEEIVVVGQEEDGHAQRKSKKKRGPKKRSHRSPRSPQSPRNSGSNVGLSVPQDEGRGQHSRATSPQGAAVSASSAVPGIPGGPIENMNKIELHFTTMLLPLCQVYIAHPPEDVKKRDDEHRKLSETVMQQVLLKLDEVDTSTEEGARARRKALVGQVQEALKSLDDAKARG